MAEQQTITYAPQWNNMTVDDVVFQTNNVVDNFNYPPNVPAYKPIMKFLLNCPFNKAFNNCPSIVYQNFLREFWSTAVAFDPFPSTDEPEKRPLREFLINQRDSVSPPPLAPKLKKGKSQTVTPTLPKSQGLEVLGALSKKSKKPKFKSHPLKPSTGLPSILDEGTRKSKPLPEGTATYPKDLGGNKQPLDKDITSVNSNEGTAKTMPRPEGSHRDKDSGGNIPPADIEPIHTPVADPSRTDAKYQVDETQSTRLRYRFLTKNEGKPSSDVEPDTKPLHLQTFANIQAYLLSEDELEKESDDEEVLAVGDDMDEDPRDDAEKFDNILPLTERKLIKYLKKVSRVLFSRITEKQWEHHEEEDVSYANLKASIDQYYDENIAHRDQTDKLMEASMSSIDRSNTTISDLYKGLYVITHFLKYINNAVKDDLAANQKINEATETFARISSNITEDTLKIKSMMAEIYQAFKATPRIDKGKGIATESKEDLSKRLVPTSTTVHPDPDALIPYTINGELEVIKVVQEEAKKIGLGLRKITSAKSGEKFKKAQDTEHQVLKTEHTEKVRKSIKLRKHKFESYMWTINNRLKPETITNIKIHPKTKLVVITVYRGTDGRNFDVHRPFVFGVFSISELDELREIIPKKKNAVIHDLMNSLSRRYERIRKIPEELGNSQHFISLLISLNKLLSIIKKNEETHDLSLKQECGLECIRTIT
ncbi:hypothetical protein Tco_0227899 [Tanacetum coccineum]